MQHIEKWTTLFDQVKEKEKEQLSDKTNHVHAVHAHTAFVKLRVIATP